VRVKYTKTLRKPGNIVAEALSPISFSCFAVQADWKALFPQEKRFQIFWKTFLPPGRKFSFQEWANREIFTQA
jgi:hypothetical protein